MKRKYVKYDTSRLEEERIIEANKTGVVLLVDSEYQSQIEKFISNNKKKFVYILNILRTVMKPPKKLVERVDGIVELKFNKNANGLKGETGLNARIYCVENYKGKWHIIMCVIKMHKNQQSLKNKHLKQIINLLKKYEYDV